MLDRPIGEPDTAESVQGYPTHLAVRGVRLALCRGVFLESSEPVVQVQRLY